MEFFLTKTIILGGGIAGLSLASFLETETVVLERDKVLGGLSRSYSIDGVAYDLGPHIIFSKNKKVLDLHASMIPTEKVRRSNQILYAGAYVQYPFENDLSKLPKEDCEYCLTEFLNNPYEEFDADNMQQFFLKTFGEGITRTYLEPYNRKIWKFDLSCMDTQMVDRIPKPPREDVIASAGGQTTEGYTHQLYFHYPKEGGFQTMVDEYARRAVKNGEVLSGIDIKAIEGGPGAWRIVTSNGIFEGEQLINCIPLHELFVYLDAPEDVKSALNALKYNSIHIVAAHYKKDNIGDHFALYVPDPSVSFHRLSKLGFLGDSYKPADGGSVLMAEITFRPNSYLASLDIETIEQQVIDGLAKLGLADAEDLVSIETQTSKYAYVIYDLDHRTNVDKILTYLKSIGIRCAGRFAEFEYLNTDGVVEHTMALADELNGGIGSA